MSTSGISSIAGTQGVNGNQPFDPAKFLDKITTSLFKKNDKDGDGSLSNQELSGLSADAFKALDTDGDGKLSADEVKASLTKALDDFKQAKSSSDPSTALSTLKDSPEGQLLKLASPRHRHHHGGQGTQGTSQSQGNTSTTNINYSSTTINITQNIYNGTGTTDTTTPPATALDVTA